jgi:hypothetical protein
MQLYESRLSWGTLATWHGTRGEAHEGAKATPVRDAARIYLWEVPTAKDNVVRALNGKRPEGLNLLSAWGLTARGGMREISINDALVELETEAEIDLQDAIENPPGASLVDTVKAARTQDPMAGGKRFHNGVEIKGPTPEELEDL